MTHLKWNETFLTLDRQNISLVVASSNGLRNTSQTSDISMCGTIYRKTIRLTAKSIFLHDNMINKPVFHFQSWFSWRLKVTCLFFRQESQSDEKVTRCSDRIHNNALSESCWQVTLAQTLASAPPAAQVSPRQKCFGVRFPLVAQSSRCC